MTNHLNNPFYLKMRFVPSAFPQFLFHPSLFHIFFIFFNGAKTKTNRVSILKLLNMHLSWIVRYYSIAVAIQQRKKREKKID